MLIFPSCANFFGLHAIICKILHIFVQFCCVFAIFLHVLCMFCTCFWCKFFKLEVVSVLFFKLFATLLPHCSESWGQSGLGSHTNEKGLRRHITRKGGARQRLMSYTGDPPTRKCHVVIRWSKSGIYVLDTLWLKNMA